MKYNNRKARPVTVILYASTKERKRNKKQTLVRKPEPS